MLVPLELLQECVVTTYLLEVDELGNQQVKVLEGEVIVKRNAIPLIDEDDEPTNKPTTNSKPNIKPSTQKPNIGSPTTVPKVKQFPAPPSIPTPVKDPAPSNVNTRPVLPQDNSQKARPLNPLNADVANDKPILKIERPTNQQDEVVLKAGEKVEVANEGTLGIVQQLTENEFVNLLKGNLFQGFTNQIPGIDKVQAVFNGLFPGVNFPISIPGIPIPSIPIPSLPRFRF